MVPVLLRLFLLAVLLPAHVLAGNIRGQQQQTQGHEVKRQLYMEDSRNRPQSGGSGGSRRRDGFGSMNGLDDFRNVSTTVTTSKNTTCPVCQSFCGEEGNRVKICIANTGVSLCVKTSVYYGGLCGAAATCGACGESPTSQSSTGPCSDQFLCDSDGEGPRKYQICRMIDGGRNRTICANEFSGIFQSNSFACGSCDGSSSNSGGGGGGGDDSNHSEDGACDDKYRCNSTAANGARLYQVCTANNATICTDATSGTFNSTFATCGPCGSRDDHGGGDDDDDDDSNGGGGGGGNGNSGSGGGGGNGNSGNGGGNSGSGGGNSGGKGGSGGGDDSGGDGRKD